MVRKGMSGSSFLGSDRGRSITLRCHRRIENLCSTQPAELEKSAGVLDKDPGEIEMAVWRRAWIRKIWVVALPAEASARNAENP